MHYFGAPRQLAKSVPSPLLVQGISACTMLVQNYFTQLSCQLDFALYWCKRVFTFWKLTKMVHFCFTQLSCQVPFWCILLNHDNFRTIKVHFWVFPKRKRTKMVRPARQRPKIGRRVLPNALFWGGGGGGGSNWCVTKIITIWPEMLLTRHFKTW